MYIQDSKLFKVCQVRNEDIEMSYVHIYSSLAVFVTIVNNNNCFILWVV